MSFSARLSASSTNPIHFIWGQNENGLNYHWFVKTPAHRIKALLAQMQQGRLYVPDYGDVVQSGLGHVPSPAGKAALLAKFHIDFDATYPA